MEKEKTWWEMKDLKKATGYSYGWLTHNILYKPCYKKILDINNGGFVYYPESRGKKWLFIADRMQEFLEKHFNQIVSK